MPWFVHRAEAEALLATIERQPAFTYEVMPNGCQSGWGIVVSDADGIITEAYDGEMELTRAVTELARKAEDDRRKYQALRPHPA